MKAERKPGRPPAGSNGRKVSSDYAPILLRIAPELKSRIQAAAEVEELPFSRLVETAFDAYWRGLTEYQRARIRRVQRRRQKQGDDS